MHSLYPMFVALAVLAVFYFGVLFGAYITTSEHRRTANHSQLLELVQTEEE